jgi:hypothetical protein
LREVFVALSKREIQEWLGVSPADFYVYLGGACCVCLFISSDIFADFFWSVAALVLGVIGCKRGMRCDPEYEELTNIFKALCYPLALMVMTAMIAVHFILLSGERPELAGIGFRAVWQECESFCRGLIK